MRTLLTGSQGYIGTILAERLVAVGHEVVGLDTGWFDECVLGPQPAAIPTMRVDVRDVSAKDLTGFDAVLHLAALSNDSLGNLNPDLTYAINHHASVRLADAARRAGVGRFLFSSSCSLYGASEAGDPTAMLDESASFAPVTPYGASKILAEQGIAELATDDFSPTFLRNATAYGFSPRLRGDIVVNDLVASALLTGEVRLLSNGQAWRPLIHVEDIADAFVALLEAPQTDVHNRAFNVAQSAENYLIRDVADLVAESVPNSRVSLAADPGSDLRNYRVSGDLLTATVPAFKPQWNVARGIEQLVDAYRRHGLSMVNFDERFRRVGRIRALLAADQVHTDLRWQ
ncbi:NAD-dependent epimerase/dehydratase family protein [Streptomyces sp. NRRL S-1824]|uniref:NAD-dependent epimerase/dehydratase family protein n=1 Tax=Streptomyces sp. NRRL S-1824 TaxID=1463889 RepID=UPI0004C67B1C|nr:SDR family oxidoreductase [Streptomyces sp. NRRL S-1824]